MAFDVICSLIFTFSVTEIPLCKVSAHFLSRFVPIILANRFQFNVWTGENHWRESSRKMCNYFAQMNNCNG